MEELSNNLIKKINKLCDKGENLLDEGNFEDAIFVFQQALAALPEPYIEWEISTMIVSAIGDAYFYQQDFAKALEQFQEVCLTPDGLNNPFVHLRLGQCYWETNDFEKAKTDLQRAYNLEGKDIFEDEDEKYLQFLLG